VALVVPTEKKYPTLGEWMGSGAGLLKEGTADLFDEPTWKEGEWNMEHDDKPL